MNNRKQKIYSVLDSITKTELENYISDKKLMKTKSKEMLELFNRVKVNREQNNLQIISSNLSKNLQETIDGYYKMGEAYIIAFVLECFYDKKYKIKDLKEYLKTMIDHDKKLKEYVYDIMKDF